MREKLQILKDVLGQYRISNQEHLFFCPYCEHHKRKLSVNLEKNVFKCWVCDWSGRDLYRIIGLFFVEISLEVQWVKKIILWFFFRVPQRPLDDFEFQVVGFVSVDNPH